MSLSDLIAAFSLLVSFLTLGIVLYDKYKASKLEKMNLKVNIVSYYFSRKGSKIYIEFSFINESSLPITICESSLSSWKESIPDTDDGHSGGSLINKIEEVSGETYGVPPDRTKYLYRGDDHTIQLPLTIKPFDSKIIYLGYYTGKASPFILPLRTDELTVKFVTTRDMVQGVANLQTKSFEYDTYDC